MRRRPLAITATTGVLVLGMCIAPMAKADPPGMCNNGTDVATSSDLSLVVDGVVQVPDAKTAGIYGEYAVSLCRWHQTGPGATNVYAWSVKAMNHNPNPPIPMELDAAALNSTFVLSFTPRVGDRMLTLEARADASAFVIDSAHNNRVTITAKPIGFSDIWGNDCPAGSTPFQCVDAVQVASMDYVANMTGAVRYADSNNVGAASFDGAPGMIESSGAFMFFVWVTCPVVGSSQATDGIKVDLGGPHYKHDATTLNTSKERVYLPASAIATCFGSSPQTFAASALITRTEHGVTQNGTTSGTGAAGLQYTISASDAGATITLPEVTFSQPTYKFRPRSGKNLARKVVTLASLAKTAKLKIPSKGHLAAVIPVATKRTLCTATSNKLFEFGKKGKVCAFTLRSIRSNGKVYASKTLKIKIP